MIRVGVRGIDPLYDHCQTEGIVHPNDPLEEKPWGSRSSRSPTTTEIRDFLRAAATALGRISYVNMARLLRPRGRRRRSSRRPRAERASARRRDRSAPISSIEYGRHAELRISRASASPPRARSTDPARAQAARAHRVGRRYARERDVHRSRPCPLPAVGEQVPLGRRRTPGFWIGDAALKSMFGGPDTPTTTSVGFGSSARACRWPTPPACRHPPVPERIVELEPAFLAALRRKRGAGAPCPRGERPLRLSARLPRALLREAPLPLRSPRTRRPALVLRARRRSRRAGARSELRFLVTEPIEA